MKGFEIIKIYADIKRLRYFTWSLYPYHMQEEMCNKYCDYIGFTNKY